MKIRPQKPKLRTRKLNPLFSPFTKGRQGGISIVNCQSSILNQRGSALIITLLIITLLVSITVEFAYEVFVGTSALSNWRSAQKASLTAKSGQALSAQYIKDIAKLPYTRISEISLPVTKDFGDGTALTVNIVDENSKFNINSIIFQNGLTDEKALASLKKLFEHLNIRPSIALAIADWIDPDLEPRLKDSEYKAKNSYLWSIDELKLIDEIDEETFKTVNPFLTVHGNGQININTAGLPVLISLHDDITETAAKRTIDYRETAPFENTTDLQRVSGMETMGPLLLGKITVKSSNFRVVATATVNDITREVESVMETSLMVHYWREG